MKNNYIGEIFNELYSKFAEINYQWYQVYKEPFKIMYNNDRDFTTDVSNTIIYYFIEHYIKERNIIIKDNKAVLSEIVYNKFYDYLYTLGLDVSKHKYKHDYKPSKADYLIKHVISTFIIENNIDLSNYINKFRDLYSEEKIVKNYSIDIVNYFIHIYNRPWKGFGDYMNEFMDYFETLDTEYIRPEVINMRYGEVSDLIKEWFERDIVSQSKEVQQLYFDMWDNLYCDNKYEGKIDKYLTAIYYYFTNIHYKIWKTKYNYEKEWKDYIETLNID